MASANMIDINALCRAIRAFDSYEDGVEENFALPRGNFIDNLSPAYKPFLDAILAKKNEAFNRAASINSDLAEAIAQCAKDFFRMSPYVGNEETKPTNAELAISRSAIRNTWRDWTFEATKERNACYAPVLNDIIQRFAGQDRKSVNVLVPGSGLGRLAWNIAGAGFSVEASEVSYMHLLATNFMLSRTIPGVGEKKYGVCPWALQFSNHAKATHQFRGYKVPEVMPASAPYLTGEPTLNAAGEMEFAAVFGGTGSSLVINSKDFTKDFAGAVGRYDVVVTCFFIDTAQNLIDYINTIKHVLKNDGVWINVGPLLWNTYENGPGGRRVGDVDADEDQQARQHPMNRNVGEEWSGKLELALDEVEMVVKMMGLCFHRKEFVDVAGYMMDEESMLQTAYKLAFWAVKKC